MPRRVGVVVDEAVGVAVQAADAGERGRGGVEGGALSGLYVVCAALGGWETLVGDREEK